MKTQSQIQQMWAENEKQLEALKAVPEAQINWKHFDILTGRKALLEKILEQDQSYIEMDDCIMPETLVAEIPVNKFGVSGPDKIAVKVDQLDEPYKSIFLSLKSHPVQLPLPLNNYVQVVSHTIFPNGSVYRCQTNLLEEMIPNIYGSKEYLTARLNKELVEELLNRYKGQ